MAKIGSFVLLGVVAGAFCGSGALGQAGDLPKRLTHPQVVAGDGFDSAIVLLNSSTTTCEYVAVAHRNVGRLATNVVVGGQSGGGIAGFLPPGAGRTLSIQSPDRTFVGAVSVDLYNPECFNAFTVQVRTQILKPDESLAGLFSYTTPQSVRAGRCALAAIHPDLDPSDGRTVAPGFATASLARLREVRLCHTLLDDRGQAITSEECLPTDGSHQASLLTDIFPEAAPGASSWQVCLESSSESQLSPSLSPLFVETITEGAATQFDVSEHQVRRPGCLEDQFNACLDDRFGVSVRFTETPTGLNRRGRIGGLSPSQSAYFSFAEPDSPDLPVGLAVQLVNGCAVNGHFWLFAASQGQVEYEITVVDTRSGQTKSYPAPPGNGSAISDTEAFATCP